MFTNHYDVLIIGARVAGAATARLMAERGLKVLVVDRAPAGTDTVSSHNLTRGACMQLGRWGLMDRLYAAGTPKITRTTLHFGAEITPIDMRDSYGAPGMLGTRRPVLDTMLAQAAEEAGATLWYHTSFRDVIRDPSGRVIGAELTDETGMTYAVGARLVVGADGLRSTVARKVGAQLVRQGRHAMGHIYAYTRDVEQFGNHAYFSETALVAATPTDGNAQIVIASTTPARLKAMRQIAGDAWTFKALAREADAGFGLMLDWAKIIEPIRVFAGTPGRMLDCSGPGWALVGDAGYFRDPVTAHGITDAFRDAELLANAAADGSDGALTQYQIERDQVTEEIWSITERIAAFDLDLKGLKEAYRDLAYAMRAEQAWMDMRFTPLAQAA